MQSAADIVTITMNPAVDASTSVDRVVPIHKLRCGAIRRDPGGGGINAARVVRRLGGGVAAVYTAGGSIGQLLRELVEREGIDSRAVRIAEETREDFTIAEAGTGQQFRFVLPGPYVSPHEWAQCLDLLASLRPFPCYLVASGSLAQGMPEDFYARVARLAKRHHAKFVVDTSGPPLGAVLEEGVYLIKPSRRELAELVSRSLDQEDALVEACRAIVERQQASVVALTLGDQGATLVTRQGTWRAPGLAVTAVSTVGAGDSFLGAMVWSLGAGHAVEKAFRYGVAAGTAAVLTPGTQLCRREDVDRLLGEVTLQAI